MERPKYYYSQSESVLTIEILEPNMNENTVHVDFASDKLTLIIERAGGKKVTVMCGSLFNSINVSKCKLKYKDEKFLVKLSKKKKGYEWPKLFGSGKKDGESTTSTNGSEGQSSTNGNNAAINTSVPTVDTSKAQNRPYASTRDWNEIERNLKREEEEDNKEDKDGAFGRFMQTMYKDADDETRRAMIKSYQTSGGTVLNCDWKEVVKKDYEKTDRVAPKGQEWRTWEGAKLSTKDD